MDFKKSALLFLILLSFKMSAQLSPEWDTTGMPFYGRQVRCIYSDTTNNLLYVTGEILSAPGNFSNYYICRYNGTVWSVLGAFNNQVLSLTTYNGELIAAGYFTSVNGTSANHIAKYNGVSWQALANFDEAITRVKVIDGNLYTVGYFSAVDSIPIHRAAKWNGSAWSDIHGFSLDPIDCMLYDIEIYNGNTYVCGNFVDGGSGINHLAMFKNGVWQGVGGGVLGSLTDLVEFTVYKNELYLAGAIIKPAGNVGHMIQKWDGTAWSEVGDGVRDMNGGYGFCSIYDMLIHNNELYVTGGFGYAGNIEANHIAKWDGSQWCGLSTNNIFDSSMNGGRSLGFYNDTLFLGIGNDTVNQIFTNKIMKYLAGNHTDTCSMNYTGVNEISNFNSFTLYPNPAQTLINIEFENASSENYTISIVNVLGQTVYSKQTSDSKIQISVDEFFSGIYVVKVQSEKGLWSRKFVKQ